MPCSLRRRLASGSRSAVVALWARVKVQEKRIRTTNTRRCQSLAELADRLRVRLKHGFVAHSVCDDELEGEGRSLPQSRAGPRSELATQKRLLQQHLDPARFGAQPSGTCATLSVPFPYRVT